MALTIPDEVVKGTGLSERDFLIEIACRLFDAERLTSAQAGRLAGISRPELWAELAKRGIPSIRYTEDDLRQDLDAIKWLEEQRAGRQ